jgi:hypothetical protein
VEERTPISRDLPTIQRRLRFLQAQNDREHESLAMKFHREEVARESGSAEPLGELDAAYETGTAPRDTPPLH